MLVNNHRKIFLSLIPKKPRDFVDCSLGTNFRGTRVSNWPRKKKTRPDVVARAVSWEQFSEAWPHSWSMVLRGWKKKRRTGEYAAKCDSKNRRRKKKIKKKKGGKKEKWRSAGCRWRENEPRRKQRNYVNEFCSEEPNPLFGYYLIVMQLHPPS